MTVTTTKLTRLYKLFAQVSLHIGPVQLSLIKCREPSHLGHVFLVISWVGLFVLLCDKKVMWICHLLKQIFHSSSKNRSDMVLGVPPRAIYHFVLLTVNYEI